MALPGGLIGLGGLGSGPLAPIVFGVELIGVLLGGLFGGGFGGPSTADLALAIHQLRDSFSRAIDQLKRFAWATAFALGTLLQVFHDIWVGFLDSLWDLLKKLAHAIARLVTEVLPRLLEWMAKMRQRLDDLYAKYVRPLLNYIQLVRRYLGILRLFHIKWAAKLDDQLSRIEGDILRPYLMVRRWLGALGQWLNILVTVRGILQRGLFLNSMYAYAGDWINLFWVAQSGQLNNKAVPLTGPQDAPDPPQLVRANMREFVTSGSGKYADFAARARAAAERCAL